MNEPHDPNRTVAVPLTPADSLDKKRAILRYTWSGRRDRDTLTACQGERVALVRRLALGYIPCRRVKRRRALLASNPPRDSPADGAPMGVSIGPLALWCSGPLSFHPLDTGVMP